MVSVAKLLVQTRHSVVSGVTKPNATVTVANLSIAPYAPDSDAFVQRAKADAYGRFKLRAKDVKHGDVLRVSDGGHWVDVLASSRAKRRRPEVELQGLRLSRDGLVLRLRNVLSNPRVAAPGTVLRFVHEDKEHVHVVSADGLAPAELPWALPIGAEIDVYVDRDGARADKRWGVLAVGGKRGRSNPAPSDESAEDGLALTQVDTSLYIEGATSGDPRQGALGDCWLVAAASALAHVDAGLIEDMIKAHDDGSFSVRLHQFDHDKQRFVAATQRVQPFFFKRDGKLEYVRSQDSGELWPLVIERAYAQDKGSYDAIACGYPFAAFEALLGVRGEHCQFDTVSAAAVWESCTEARTRPTLAVTRAPDSGLDFEGAGLVSDHAYTVLGGVEKDGVRYVRLRNPWGSFEPVGNGKDDGVFLLELDQYVHYFAYASSAILPALEVG